jgi:Cdc6-like AAA superfamily ATPase
VDRLHERQDARERREEHQAILDWITPIDYATQQSDFIGRRQEGTGQWLLYSDGFKSWMNQSNQVLFFSGIPGSGKTMCASIVINELQAKFRNDGSVGIAYIYCNFRRHQDQKDVDLLASLLKQFSQALFFVPESLKILYECHRSQRTRPSLEEVSQTLESVVSKFARTFVIIDALDECDDSDGDRKRLLRALLSLQTKTGVCLLATSRSIPNIEKEFGGRNTRMEIRASDHDLNRYIDENLTRLPTFVLRNADLQKEVKSSIIGAVDGMYALLIISSEVKCR